MGWVSPTSHSGTWYSDPEKAYDGDTGTFAYMSREDEAFLTPAAPLLCSKIRVWASVLTWYKADLTISVYYGGAYHQIFDGQVTTYTDYMEVEIGSIQTVSNVKIVPHTITLSDCLHEFQFWEEAAPPVTINSFGTPRAARQFNSF